MYCMAVLARTAFAVSNKPQPCGRAPCPVAQRHTVECRFIRTSNRTVRTCRFRYACQTCCVAVARVVRLPRLVVLSVARDACPYWLVPSISVSRFEIGFCPLLSVRHKSCGMNDCPVQTRLGISGGNSPDPIQLFEQMQTLVYRQVEAESLFLLLERCHFHSRPIHASSLSAFQAPLHRRCPLDVLTPAC